jgi:hypothetical protein
LPEDYLAEYTKGKDGPICTLLIESTYESFAVFGMPLFQGYYTTHYMIEGLISFTPHNQSNKKDIASIAISTATPK